MSAKSTHPVTRAILGIAALSSIAILGHILVSSLGIGHRGVDFTETKVHTLSDGTRAIVKELQAPVVIRYYASRSASYMPEALKLHMRRDDDQLTAEMSLLEDFNDVVERISAALAGNGTGITCRPGFTFDGVGCWPDDPTRGTGPSSTLLLLARSWYLVTTNRLPSPDVDRVAIASVDDGRTHPGYVCRVERPPRV